MKNKISNLKYNKLLYDSRPVKFSEYLSNKYSIIHKELFDSALLKYITSLNDDNIKTIKDFKNIYNIIEYKNDEYWQPSSIVYISKSYPYTKKSVDLSPYWNNYQDIKNESLEDLKIYENNVGFNDVELIYIDYINGKCKLRNKMNNDEFWVSFSQINDKIVVADDYSLSNLFSSKIAW